MLRNNLQTARKAVGLTQQAIADKLGLTLRHYQKIEYADINGAFEVWDALEDLLGVHQRIWGQHPVVAGTAAASGIDGSVPALCRVGVFAHPDLSFLSDRGPAACGVPGREPEQQSTA
ncbi:helix-turn-helix transcriptional regulator [uncultured Flavonifractor sp.]|uniref:helix-turn-helix transcriptional regulator n=1 Tax=uncultured Flavonifractor sp. TaxID=1193534 RepID=UPI003415F2FF